MNGIADGEGAVPSRVPEDASQPLSDTASDANAAQPPREECASKPFRPEIRPAAEPTCCGSDCDDCPF